MERFIRKNDNECFVGAIQYLYFKKYNKYISELVIKDYFKYSNKGVSIESVENNANKIGATAKAYKIVSDVKIEDYFLIVLNKSNQYHYVCAWCKDGLVKFFDPGDGKVKVLNSIIGLIIIKFEYDANYIPIDSTVKKEKYSELKMWYFLVSIAVSIIMILFSGHTKLIVDNVSKQKDVTKVSLQFVLLAITLSLLIYFKKILASIMIEKQVRHTINTFINKLYVYPISFKRYIRYERIKNFVTEVSYFARFEQASIIDFQISLITFIGVFLIIVKASFTYVLIAIAHSLIMSALARVFNKKSYNYEQKENETSFTLDSKFNSFYKNISESKLQSMHQSNKELSIKFEELVNVGKKSDRFNICFDFLNSGLGRVFTIIVALIVFGKINSQTEIGFALFNCAIIAMFSALLHNILNFVLNYRKNSVYKYKVSDLLAEFKVTEFSYNGSTKPFKLITLCGQKQLVGSNGSGKSTAIKVALGLESNVVKNSVYLCSDSWSSFGDCGYGLSDGQRQIQNIEQILKGDYEFICLDEALNSIHIKKREELYSKLLSKFKNIIIVDHDVDLKINKELF